PGPDSSQLHAGDAAGRGGGRQPGPGRSDHRDAGTEGAMKRKKRGQSLVEMAMISPFLIMILLMMIDCGRAAYAYATLANAARDGARTAITTGNNRPDNSWVVGAVQQNAYGVRLNPGTCMNDAPPASPSMSPNTGLVYVGAGSGNTTTNAPAGQAPAAAAGS